MYNESIKRMMIFGQTSRKNRLDKKFTKIKNIKYSNKDVNIKWFEDGFLNVSYNCIDRHLKKILIE